MTSICSHGCVDKAFERDPESFKGLIRKDGIILIDWLPDISATVKLRLQVHENVFVAHLCFAKGCEGWKIVTKIWHLESTAEIVTMD